MKLRAHHYAVLRCLYIWSLADVQQLTLDQIDYWCSNLDRARIRRTLDTLADRDRHNNNPLVVRTRGRYAITETGKRLVRSAGQKPALPQSLHRWKDEVLSGMRPDGKPTTKENPVLSTATAEGGQRDLDCAFFIFLARELRVSPSEVPDLMRKRNDLRFCKGCEDAGRFPFRPLSEFWRHQRDGYQSRCKRCQQEEDYQRRTKKKENQR